MTDPKCEATQPPDGAGCERPATRVVRFSGPDGGSARTCAECALRLAELAIGFGTSVRVERLL